MTPHPVLRLYEADPLQGANKTFYGELMAQRALGRHADWLHTLLLPDYKRWKRYQVAAAHPLVRCCVSFPAYADAAFAHCVITRAPCAGSLHVVDSTTACDPNNMLPCLGELHPHRSMFSTQQSFLAQLELVRTPAPPEPSPLLPRRLVRTMRTTRPAPRPRGAFRPVAMKPNPHAVRPQMALYQALAVPTPVHAPRVETQFFDTAFTPVTFCYGSVRGEAVMTAPRPSTLESMRAEYNREPCTNRFGVEAGAPPMPCTSRRIQSAIDTEDMLEHSSPPVYVRLCSAGERGVGGSVAPDEVMRRALLENLYGGMTHEHACQHDTFASLPIAVPPAAP